MTRSELIAVLTTFPSPNDNDDPEVTVELDMGQWTTTPIIGIRADGVEGIALTLNKRDTR
jgi:hypothetical protein